jgi:biotin transport system substrate-specific component
LTKFKKYGKLSLFLNGVKKMQASKLKRVVLDGMMLAVMIVCAQITIPLPLIPLTLQTFAVGIIASLLPLIDGFQVILVYILLGVVGLPVYAGFSSGTAALLGPTGGYLVSFVVYQLVTAAWLTRSDRSAQQILLANCCGALLNLLIGSLWMIPVLHLSWQQALLTGLVPFLLPALIKIVVLLPIVLRLKGLVAKTFVKPS